MSLRSGARAARARFWGSLIGQWQSSSLTQAEFCRRRDLRAANFAWWKRRLSAASERLGRKQSLRRAASSADFVELTWPAPAAGGYEVVLSRGRVLRIPARFEDQAVVRLIAAVESADALAAAGRCGSAGGSC